jgi:feruloyl esterase
MRAILTLAAGAAALLAFAGAARAETACADLAAHAPAHTRILSAEEIAAEPGKTPAFCRVKGEIAAVPASRVGFELWLPAEGWNGKFEMVGNGGYGSEMDVRSLARLTAAGYSVAATDTGHQGDDPAFAEGHPEALVDWSWRAVHVTAVAAKALVRARYAAEPKHSYFAGCSTGGHQAMSEAQRFPQDFDGIIAGDSGGDRTHLNAGFLWQYLANHRADGSQIIPASKLPMITRAAVAACRGDNGVRAGGLPDDDFLDDPGLCRFQPASLKCAAADGPDCLTGEQVKALEAMYAGPHDPVTGALVANGYARGSESTGGSPVLPGWSLYWADPANPTQPARMNFWRIWAGFGQGFDPRRFDFHRDMRLTDARLAKTVNAINPDLSGFRRRGGKLIAYQGEADPVTPAQDAIDLHEAVVKRQGRTPTDGFYRLFLVPGMGHCMGGPGLGRIDAQPALEAWVEKAQAPDQIIARHDASATTFTRPVCAYPRQAAYVGKGDPARAKSFECRMKGRG